MSQLEQGSPIIATLRNQAPRVPASPGATVMPVAPGLAPTPPVSRGAQLAGQLAQALGMLGQTAGQVAKFADRESYMARLEAQRAEQFERGEAAFEAGKALPDIVDKIGRGEIEYPMTGEVQPTAETVVDQYMPEGLSEYGQDEWRRRMTANVSRSMLAAREVAKAKTTAELVQNLRDQATGMQTAAELSNVVSAAVTTLGMTRDEALGAIAVHALNVAARSGEPNAFSAAANTLGETYKAEVEQAQIVFDGAIKQAQREAKQLAIESVYDRLNAREWTTAMDRIRSLDESGQIDGQTRAQLQQKTLGMEQEAHVSALGWRIMNGTIDRDELKSILDVATYVAPDQLGHIPLPTALGLLSALGSKQDADLARLQVEGALDGATVNLTPAQHDAAFMAVIGPGGTGVIDSANQITDPTKLTAAILRTGLMPTALRQTLLSGLTSDDQQGVLAAATTIGMVLAENNPPNLRVLLSQSAGDELGPAIETARDLWESGRLASEQTRPAALAAIKDAIETGREPKVSRPDAMEKLHRQGVVVGDEVQAAMDEAIAKSPWTNDWFWDPTTDVAGAALQQRMLGWYAAKYAELERSMPDEKAREAARRWVQTKVENDVDFVRWNNVVMPTLVDEGRGMRMPGWLRWGTTTEADIRKALSEQTEVAKALSDAGLTADDIVGFRPHMDQTDPNLSGWIPIDQNGSMIIGQDGRPLIYRPDPATRAKINEANLLRELRQRDKVKRTTITPFQALEQMDMLGGP